MRSNARHISESNRLYPQSNLVKQNNRNKLSKICCISYLVVRKCICQKKEDVLLGTLPVALLSSDWGGAPIMLIVRVEQGELVKLMEDR